MSLCSCYSQKPIHILALNARQFLRWESNNISICKVDCFEETVKALGLGHFLLIVVSVTHSNVKQIQQQIETLRSLTNVPLLALAEEPLDVSDKLVLLTNGADQYLQPPLSSEEIYTSMMALIRRYTELNKQVPSDMVYYDYGIIVAPAQRMVYIGERKVELLKKEFDILSLLMRNHGIVLTYEQIFSSVWGYEYIDNSRNILWNQIRSLREKIQISAEMPKYIKTVHGIGYCFAPCLSA